MYLRGPASNLSMSFRGSLTILTRWLDRFESAKIPSFPIPVSFADKLRDRWDVTLWGVVAILMAFSLAGMTVVTLRTPILWLFLPADAPTWLRWAVYLAIIFPLYQVLLLGYGALLGQFQFFWGRLRIVLRFITQRIAGTPK
jgi:hypothetical protein